MYLQEVVVGDEAWSDTQKFPAPAICATEAQTSTKTCRAGC